MGKKSETGMHLDTERFALIPYISYSDVPRIPRRAHNRRKEGALLISTHLQTFRIQLRRRTILRLEIPVPNPMHPLPQLPRHLLRIVFNARSAHSKQDTRLPTCLDDTLSPRSTDLIIGVEHVRDLRAVGGSGRVGEEVLEDEGVFEGLACALALPGCSRVGGVAD